MMKLNKMYNETTHALFVKQLKLLEFFIRELKMIARCIVISILIMFSGSTLASGSGGVRIIKQISVNGPHQHDRMVIDNGVDPDGCLSSGGVPGGYNLDKNNPKYKQLYGALIAAAMAKKTVTFWLNGCLGGEPSIENITVQF